jgi:hypothetical protein
VPKISCINNNFLALGRVSKLATMWALSFGIAQGDNPGVTPLYKGQ